MSQELSVLNKKRKSKERTRNKLKPDIVNFRFSFFFASVYLLISNLTIFNSGYSGDDWPNSQTPYWIQWRYDQISLVNVFKEALYWTNEWMVGQGRFYPLQFIESRFAFSYLKSPFSYNIYKYSILILCELTFVLLIYLLTRSHRLVILLGILIPAFTRYRSDFDPHIAFAGLVPSFLLKVFVACIFINLAFNKNPSKFKLFIYSASVMYFAAMCTYEYAFLLFPLLIYSFLISKLQTDIQKSKFSESSIYKQILNTIMSQRFRPILISWLSYAFLVFVILRPKSNPQGAYELGISTKSFNVFTTQLFTGLPIFDLNKMKGTLGIFILGLLTLIIYFIVQYTNTIYLQKLNFESEQIRVSNSILKNYIFPMSITLISCQGIMLSLQPVWFDKADLTHSYLGVLSTELGSSLLFSIIILKLLSLRGITNEN